MFPDTRNTNINEHCLTFVAFKSLYGFKIMIIFTYNIGMRHIPDMQFYFIFFSIKNYDLFE